MKATGVPRAGADRSGARPLTAALAAQAVLESLGRAERVIELDPGQTGLILAQASRRLTPTAEAPRRPRTANAPELARWQERRVLRHIREHVDRPITNQDLAAVVKLSVGQFSRRFKASFGFAPHEFVVRSRVDRCKKLMRRTTFPLSQIALESGFCDQAHMARTFRLVVGSTPTRWRREQLTGPGRETSKMALEPKPDWRLLPLSDSGAS